MRPSRALLIGGCLAFFTFSVYIIIFAPTLHRRSVKKLQMVKDNHRDFNSIQTMKIKSPDNNINNKNENGYVGRKFEDSVRLEKEDKPATTAVTSKSEMEDVASPDRNSSWVEDVSLMMKSQLEIPTPIPKFVVRIGCPSKPSWGYACVKKDCQQLSNNLEERLKSLYSPDRVLTPAQDELLWSIAQQIPENDVILFTAASSNHFEEMQAMMKSLHRVVYPELSKRENFSMVLWDIGLSKAERIKAEKCCRCQVVSFPFGKFPPAMKDLRCYMWKPLVIRMTQLRARKFAVWQDASIRFNIFPGPLYERGEKNGLLLLRQKGGVSIPNRTLPETIQYFGQTVCSYSPYPEIASGFGVYKNGPFVLRAITNPWASCAFQERCLCPKPSWWSYKCKYGPCHRFDQSALGVITATIYTSEIYRIALFPEEMSKYFTIQRTDKIRNYFNISSCPSH